MARSIGGDVRNSNTLVNDVSQIRHQWPASSKASPFLLQNRKRSILPFLTCAQTSRLKTARMHICGTRPTEGRVPRLSDGASGTKAKANLSSTSWPSSSAQDASAVHLVPINTHLENIIPPRLSPCRTLTSINGLVPVGVSYGEVNVPGERGKQPAAWRAHCVAPQQWKRSPGVPSVRCPIPIYVDSVAPGGARVRNCSRQ
ncbi:hypothetical protein BC832DRAFT_67550 [Gaertneriomyces semiglobifer]|nr:hypothetical protein BC832DRAFT_67550 [Gaertneriomyces semiglobifer]